MLRAPSFCIHYTRFISSSPMQNRLYRAQTDTRDLSTTKRCSYRGAVTLHHAQLGCTTRAASDVFIPPDAVVKPCCDTLVTAMPVRPEKHRRACSNAMFCSQCAANGYILLDVAGKALHTKTLSLRRHSGASSRLPVRRLLMLNDRQPFPQ